MPSAEPTLLTDDLWLAAHDSVDGKPQIGDWSLGVGLATGLLAELVHGGFLNLREGELFRTTAEPPDDPALRPLLIKMETEEQSWPPMPHLPPVQARARVVAHGDWRPGPEDHAWPPRVPDGPSWHPLPVQEQTRHRQRGHQLGVWMSYLAYEQRAEDRVVERLARAGLVQRVQRRRLLAGTTVRYRPCDSVASGNPANTISAAIQSRRDLSRSGLLLAGLFLATGLHHHALATLSAPERSVLAEQLKRGLDGESRELLRAADAAVGEAAMR